MDARVHWVTNHRATSPAAHFMWRPQFRDPADELVLEAAVNGQAAAIVTFNQRDFGDTPATFGIEGLSPAELLGRIRT
jgi:predicted nucleic acid-binding protein